MTVHLTEAQARKLGFTPTKSTSTKKGMGRGKAETRCATCGEVCAGETAEKRHNDETGHGRFEIPL